MVTESRYSGYLKIWRCRTPNAPAPPPKHDAAAGADYNPPAMDTERSPSHCFHCGLDVPEQVDLPVTFEGATHPTCCAGCQAVAESIIAAGLGSYYHRRTAEAQQAALPPQEVLAQLKLYDLPDVQAEFVAVHSEHEREAVLMLSGVTCAACVWLIEQQLLRLNGVLRAEINYSTLRARVAWDNSRVALSDILLCVRRTGYEAAPYDADKVEAQAQAERRQALTRLWVAGLAMMQVMMYIIPVYLYGGDIEPWFLWILHWASMILTLPVIFYSAVPFFKGAWRDLKNRRLGMDTPVAIAVAAAFAASFVALVLDYEKGIYFDSVSMFVFLLLGGRYLEQVARRKAGDAAERLVKLVPAFCHRLSAYPDTSQVEEAVVARLRSGDVLLVKAGEVLPADGEVVSGESDVNEAILTGESLPVAKTAGDSVTAGTLNLGSPLLVRVAETGANTRLGHIVRLLDRALAEKPRMVELADRHASTFVLGLLLLSVLVFGVWLYLADFKTAWWITVSLLVVTCPCALSLATPAALAAATGRLAGEGVLIGRGHSLETLSEIDTVVLDKTGTLTEGRLQVEAVLLAEGTTRTTAVAAAQALERQSEHPVAQALLALPDAAAAGAPAVTSEQILNRVGHGIAAMLTLNDVRDEWRIGRLSYVAEIAGTLPDTLHSEHPGTAVYLGNRHGFAAVFLLQDQIKAGVADMVAALHRQGLRLHLLSGDRPAAVQHVADTLKLDACRAEATPEDKLAYVQDLQEQGHKVLMVGDGINDAPVLAQADVSAAVAEGADVAREGADVLLLNRDMRILPQLTAAARRTRRIIRENLGWATLYNLIAVPLAAFGFVTPFVAALGMSLSSLLVSANALRLLKK